MYTVKQLSRLAGVTSRTLHYYDEIGLLKPKEILANGYRLYDEQSVFDLQQILLFRNMDIPLAKVKRLISQKDYDQKGSLIAHREALVNKIHQCEQIIETIDSTIDFLNGEKQMKTAQFFTGLSEEQTNQFEKEAMKKYDPETVKSSNQKWKNYSKEVQKRIIDEGNTIYTDLFNAMPDGFSSDKVQKIIQRWRDHLNYFWTPELDQLLGLADLYNEDPRFKSNFDKLSPDLSEFMRNAVRVYVEKETGK